MDDHDDDDRIGGRRERGDDFGGAPGALSGVDDAVAVAELIAQVRAENRRSAKGQRALGVGAGVVAVGFVGAVVVLGGEVGAWLALGVGVGAIPVAVVVWAGVAVWRARR